MGGLPRYTEPFRVVPVATAEGTAEMRAYGLDLDAIMVLARDYAQHLSPIYDRAKSGDLTGEEMLEIAVEMIEEVPTLINLVLMFGLRAEGDEELEVVRRLPVGVKIELLDAIIGETFRSESQSGKVFEIVRRAAASARLLLPPRQP